MKKKPSLADQHWRLSLRRKQNAKLEDDLKRAIEDGNLWRFDILMKMDIHGLQYEALLDVAVKYGRVEVFQALAPSIKLGKEDFREYAITAAENGHLNMLRVLIEKHKVPLDMEDGALLVRAASNNRLGVMDYLLSKKVRIDINYANAIAAAAREDHVAAVQKLFETKPRRTKEYVGYIFDEAIEANSDKVILYMIDRGADFLDSGKDVLKAASGYGRADIVEKLLKKGVSASAGDNDALLVAIEKEHFGVADILLAAGADINAQKGQALHDAADSDALLRVQYILEKGGDPNIINDGETPLQRVTGFYGEQKDIAELLLERGANPESNKYAAVHAAVRYRNKDLLKAFAVATRKIRNNEKTMKREEFKKAFPGAYSLDDLRKKKGSSGQTGLLVAAQTGKFGEIVRAASGGKIPQLISADLFHPDEGVDTVLAMLIRHRNVQQFFETVFWVDRPDELQKTVAVLPADLRRRIRLDDIEAAQRTQRVEKRLKGILPKISKKK